MREAKSLEASLLEQISKPPEGGLEPVLAEHLRVASMESRNLASVKSKAKAIRPYLINRVISDAPQIATEMIRDWNHLAPATVNRRLALLKRLCTLAFEKRYTTDNVGPLIKTLAENNERDVYLSHDEVEALAAAMPASGDGVRLSAYTGMTVSEIFTVSRRNVKRDTLALVRSKTLVAANVPIPENIKHIVERLPLPFTEAVRRTEWDVARRSLGLEHVVWHDLRHSYAAFLVEAGATDRQVQYQMRLKTLAMVQRYTPQRPSTTSVIVLPKTKTKSK